MHRAEREITRREDIEAIIHRSQVCRLALSDGRQPYIVPLCFGYRDNVLYFHSAPYGRKIDILRTNPNVCFEFDLDCRAKPAIQACQWGMHYQSVIGFGKATFIEEPEAKRQALAMIVAQYSDANLEMTPEQIAGTLLFRVDIAEMYGKSA